MSCDAQTLLMQKLSAIAPFADLSEPDDSQATRAASGNGYAAIEFQADKTILFVQTLDMGATEIAQHSAMLLAVLGFYCPTRKHGDRWLNASLEARSTQKLNRRKESKNITLRWSSTGVFLEVQNA